MNEKHKILKHYFGYDGFREGQEVLIDSILAGKDTVGIMPTGAGKSICYQVPALMMTGITLVISPLISLMQDQVSTLNQAGVHAAYLNSSLSYNQYRLALRYAEEGRYKIIYVAPERLMTEEFQQFAAGADISMISVDEAHCVSQWGQDFRPSYLKIMEFVDCLPNRPIISAFTATATKQVKEDIISILRLQDPTCLTTGFDRSNLFFSVKTPGDKFAEVSRYLMEHGKQSGIIYCQTRKVVEEVHERLLKEGYAVTRYHAGLSDRERKQNQEDFIYDVKPIMVATNAFGMGIDKSNVRFVIHYNMPKDMESYYQEAGRAGRDEEPSECILLYGGQDVVLNQFFIDQNRDNDELDEETLEVIKQRDRERLKKMTFYCITNECLREYMLRYFGEFGDNYCGNCSNCLTQFETEDVTESAKKIIGCVASINERFGMTMVVDILHGSKAAKIKNYGFESNDFYGTLSEVTIPKLRQILNHLVLLNYLHLTEDKYPVLQLTDESQTVLDGDEEIVMKMAKENERPVKKKAKKKSAVLHDVDENLFEQLRELRMSIAKEEHVPPYIIFSDKSLVDMCAKLPKTKEDMLEVSGVGDVKFEKYGQRFLDIINQ
ncbi:ATP-dependent DNA helicase RecQ [Lachnospiraceae bacterium KM106-2]|nr:ATP-dependent DNA helicase RecQ [Lachnospiraceae bacterium KM106-2]